MPHKTHRMYNTSSLPLHKKKQRAIWKPAHLEGQTTILHCVPIPTVMTCSLYVVHDTAIARRFYCTLRVSVYDMNNRPSRSLDHLPHYSVHYWRNAVMPPLLCSSCLSRATSLDGFFSSQLVTLARETSLHGLFSSQLVTPAP